MFTGARTSSATTRPPPFAVAMLVLAAGAILAKKAARASASGTSLTIGCPGFEFCTGTRDHNERRFQPADPARPPRAQMPAAGATHPQGTEAGRAGSAFRRRM